MGSRGSFRSIFALEEHDSSQVEPGLRVFVLLHSPLPHQVGRVVKQGHLGVRVGLSEHCNSLSNMYAN